MADSSLDYYLNAKPIHIPFLDKLIAEIAKYSLIFGVILLCMLLLSKYLQHRFESLSADEEKEKLLYKIGILLSVSGGVLFVVRYLILG